MENREMPILHKSQAFRQPTVQMGQGNIFFAGTSRQRKNLFLRGLCASVVRANNLILCLITFAQAGVTRRSFTLILFLAPGMSSANSSEIHLGSPPTPPYPFKK
jgi:hypothetical protein